MTAPLRNDAEWLRQFLTDRDAPCPNCGYNLRGLTGAACPECNAALELRVGLVEPRLGAFLCGAIALGAGLGFNGFVLGYYIWEQMWGRWRFGSGAREHTYTLLVSLAVLGLLLTGWIRMRAMLRRLPPGPHWALALAWWLVTAASAIWFFATV